MGETDQENTETFLRTPKVTGNKTTKRSLAIGGAVAAVVVVAVVLGCVFGLSGIGAGCGQKEDNKTKGDLASSIIVT